MTPVNIPRTKVGLYDLVDWLEGNVGPAQSWLLGGDVEGTGWYLLSWTMIFEVGFHEPKMAALCALRWA